LKYKAWPGVGSAQTFTWKSFYFWTFFERGFIIQDLLVKHKFEKGFINQDFLLKYKFEKRLYYPSSIGLLVNV